jgi:hypothetical protein
MQASNSEDRRRQPRYVLNQSLRVLDPSSQQPIGDTVNVSQGGFMLVSKQPLAVREVHALTLVLPEAVDGLRRIDIEARCVWCQQSSFNQDYGAGFEITRLSSEDRARLEQLFSAFRSSR